MTDAAHVEPVDLPRLLLAGEVASRPDGLERALTRAGFRVLEAERPDPGAPADAVLLTVGPLTREALAELLGDAEESPPRIVLFAEGDPELPGLALDLGADDAVLAPVHLPELCARLHARIRGRQAPRRTGYEREARAALETLVSEARTTLLPDEIVLALVRRLARAFDLAGCALVAGETPERVRVVAEAGPLREPEPLELRAHPEIVEALRTGRAVTMQHPGPAPTLVLPVGAPAGRTALLLRPHEGRPPLAATQLSLASSLGAAAARALVSGGRGDETANLERRLQEEFERARRYALSFSLVLVAIDALEDTLGRLGDEAGTRLLAEVATELRRTLRLPDYVGRYAAEGFAIVLPETDLAGARRSVSRVRERLASIPFEPAGRRAALSAGIVAFPHPAVVQPDDMFALVEAALRRGRVQAGDRIGVAE